MSTFIIKDYIVSRKRIGKGLFLIYIKDITQKKKRNAIKESLQIKKIINQM